MVARVTLAEVDTVRMRLDALIDSFKESVVPAQREQPGYWIASAPRSVRASVRKSVSIATV